MIHKRHTTKIESDSVLSLSFFSLQVGFGTQFPASVDTTIKREQTSSLFLGKLSPNQITVQALVEGFFFFSPDLTGK